MIIDTLTPALETRQHKHGFPNNPYQVTLSYSPITRQVTLTPTGSSFDIYVNGVKFTKTGPQVSTAHDNSTSAYFISYDPNGVLQTSNTPWSIAGSSIPVCSLYYNAALTDAVALYELHSATRNPESHHQQHFSVGTMVLGKTGFELFGWTANSDSSAAVTFGVAAGTILDEDIKWIVSQLNDLGPYTILYRTGASEWTWSKSLSLPYLYNIGNTNNILQYNRNNAGIWSMANLTNSNYVNYYLFASTALDSEFRFFLIPGPAEHATVSSYQAENVSIIGSTGSVIPIEEYAPLWKLTYRYQTGYDGVAGRARLIEASRLVGTKVTITGTSTFAAHNSLSGRDGLDCHPASSVTVTPSGNIISTDVASAIQELDSEKCPLIPEPDNAIDIGSSSNSFKDIFAYNATIKSLAGSGNRPVYSDPNGLLSNSSSDINLKTNISNLHYGLDEILTMNPIQFNWIDSNKGTQNEIGLIAQEVANIVPEVVGVNSDSTLTLDYAKLVVVLISAIQQLNKKIVALESYANIHFRVMR
jgi:hypothetical protein